MVCRGCRVDRWESVGNAECQSSKWARECSDESSSRESPSIHRLGALSVPGAPWLHRPVVASARPMPMPVGLWCGQGGHGAWGIWAWGLGPDGTKAGHPTDKHGTQPGTSELNRTRLQRVILCNNGVEFPGGELPRWQDWSVPPTDTGNANHKATRRSEGSRTAESPWLGPWSLDAMVPTAWLPAAGCCCVQGTVLCSRPDQPPTSPTCTRTIKRVQGIGLRLLCGQLCGLIQ